MTEDLSGRSQIFRNISVSWIVHLFVLAAGFIIPRQISDHLGPTSLGIWDLGWGVIQYLSLTSLGLSSALTRYTGLYRAQGNSTELNKATTALVIWQSCVAILVTIGAAGFALLVEQVITFQNEQELQDAKVVITYFGFTLGIRMLASPAGGLITGCHRYDIQNSIMAFQDVAIAVFLIKTLFMGGGLQELAKVVFTLSCFAGIARVYFAKKLVPEVQISLKFWSPKTAFEMLKFGSKTLLTSSQKILIFQTVVFFLAAHAGPAAVAVFNRGLALVRHMETITSKFSNLFITITSGLIGLDKKDEARKLIIDSGRYTMAILLPIAGGLIFYGDIILKLWMGEGYGNWKMLIILVIGSLLPISQTSVNAVLAGFNSHGKLAIYSFMLTLIILATLLPLTTIYQEWNAITAACIVFFSWSFGRGALIPIYVKIKFSIGLTKYFLNLIILPLIANLPLFICLHFGRRLYLNEQYTAVPCIWLLGVILTSIPYWFLIIEKNKHAVIKDKLIALITVPRK